MDLTAQRWREGAGAGGGRTPEVGDLGLDAGLALLPPGLGGEWNGFLVGGGLGPDGGLGFGGRGPMDDIPGASPPPPSRLLAPRVGMGSRPPSSDLRPPPPALISFQDDLITSVGGASVTLSYAWRAFLLYGLGTVQKTRNQNEC